MKYSRRRIARRPKPSAIVPWYARKYSIGEMATNALKGVAYLKGLVNSERLYFDKNDTVSPDYNGSITLLSGIPVGDDTGYRTGNSILARSLYLNLSATMNSSATTTIIRVVVFMDTLNTGTTPTVSNILSVVGNGYAPLCPINVDSTPRYRIMFDRKLTFSNTGTRLIRVTKYIKLMKHIKYTGVNATDVYKNNIYVVYISDQLTNVPAVNLCSRLGYHDN